MKNFEESLEYALIRKLWKERVYNVIVRDKKLFQISTHNTVKLQNISDKMIERLVKWETIIIWRVWKDFLCAKKIWENVEVFLKTESLVKKIGSWVVSVWQNVYRAWVADYLLQSN